MRLPKQLGHTALALQLNVRHEAKEKPMTK
jgi:hypothetical protein